MFTWKIHKNKQNICQEITQLFDLSIIPELQENINWHCLYAHSTPGNKFTLFNQWKYLNCCNVFVFNFTFFLSFLFYHLLYIKEKIMWLKCLYLKKIVKMKQWFNEWKCLNCFFFQNYYLFFYNIYIVFFLLFIYQ